MASFNPSLSIFSESFFSLGTPAILSSRNLFFRIDSLRNAFTARYSSVSCCRLLISTLKNPSLYSALPKSFLKTYSFSSFSAGYSGNCFLIYSNSFMSALLVLKYGDLIKLFSSLSRVLSRLFTNKIKPLLFITALNLMYLPKPYQF